MLDAPDDVANAASQAASAVAQTILTNVQALAGGQPMRNAKVADPETFDGNQEKTEQFVQSVCIAVTMQINTFTDERMKILYALSFMSGGMAQVWAAMRPAQPWPICPHSTPSRTPDVHQKDLWRSR